MLARTLAELGGVLAQLAAGHVVVTSSGLIDGYGDTGFQATGVTFPREGCWLITGRVGRTSLTFITFVIKQPARTASQR